jgi:uncharacterized damage-inducible protein DinB
MDGVQQLERLFAYDAWANREVLSNLEKASASATPPSPRSLRLLSHVAAAELVWLARLENRKAPLAVWPELTLAQCAEQVKKLPRVWQDYFADLSPDDLPTTIAYVNSKGEKFDSSVGDVLLHVVLHSAYHRGQIASDVRATGRDPAYTDYIHCARTGLLST